MAVRLRKVRRAGRRRPSGVSPNDERRVAGRVVGGARVAREVATRVAIADAHAAVREGLPPLLAREGLEVVAAAATVEEAAVAIVRDEPDVALVGADLGDRDGLALLRVLARRNVRTATVLYAADDDGRLTAAALDGGAAGVVSTQSPIVELAEALRAVAAGRLWFEEPVERTPRPAPLAPLLDGLGERRAASLSDAERRVLALLADGSSTEEVAALLSLSPHTVRTHVRNVMRKLDATSRAHAVAIAIRERVIAA